MMKKCSLQAWFVFLLFWLPCFAHAATFQAKVIHITDGDTISVLNEAKEEIKIRLNGIDCPEMGQAYGNAGKNPDLLRLA